MKPVILLTTGTRGDVQPFIALGLALQIAGLPVKIVTDARYSALAAAYHLPCLPLEGNPIDLIKQPGLQSALTYDGSLVRSLRATLGYVRAAQPVYRKMLSSGWHVCQEGGALVVGLHTLWGAHIAEALHIPCTYAFLQPLSRTSAFSSPLIPFRLPPWPALNRLSYLLVEQASWLPWRSVINAWRRSQLGLPADTWWGNTDHQYVKNADVLYAFSSLVVSRPPDWPARHRLTGFWSLDPPPSWRPPPALEDFIASGPVPLYIGFGSDNLNQKRLEAESILKALHLTGQRAILGLPSEVIGKIDPQATFLVQDIPFSWLFANCAALVHHGGAGTTAAGLRAGVPQMIIPRVSDQIFWANRVYALGISPRPGSLSSLSGPLLVQAFQQLVQDPLLKSNAQHLSARMANEQGAAVAAADFLSSYSSFRETA
jgi:sterol 3beta-glucosyltransferase